MIGVMWSLETSRGQRVPIRSLPALVGSERTADVVLRHASIAAAHARLLPNGGDGLRVDVLDGAALLVEGRPVERAALRAGDTFVLGRLQFTLRQDVAADEGGDEDSATRAPSARQAAATTLPRSVRSAAPAGGRQRPAATGGGLLRADLGQLAPLALALLVLLLLLLAALLVYGVQALVVALA